MNIKYVFGFLCIAIISACSNTESHSFKVKGKIKNYSGGLVYLKEVPFGAENPIVLDSCKVDTSGTFSLKSLTRDENIYLVTFKQGPEVMVINDVPEVQLSIDPMQFKMYEASGSPASKQLHDFMNQYSDSYSDAMKTIVALDTLPEKLANNEAIVDSLTEVKTKKLSVVNALINQFCQTSKSPAAITFAVSNALRTATLPEVQQLSKNAVKRFPTNRALNKLVQIIDAQIAKDPALFLIDKPAPDFALNDTANKEIKLSSFKGKYLLVDFWASWCRPCRAENPNVVKAYKQFKSSHFDILGVSLDSSKTDWIKAIQNDSLTWHHVTDFKQWDGATVAAYKVQSIPFNVLIDPQGKVVATDLRGQALIQKLQQVLPK